MASSAVLKAESQEENLLEMALLEGREMGFCLVIERACVEETRPRRASAEPAMSFMVRVEPCSEVKSLSCDYGCNYSGMYFISRSLRYEVDGIDDVVIEKGQEIRRWGALLPACR